MILGYTPEEHQHTHKKWKFLFVCLWHKRGQEEGERESKQFKGEGQK